MTLLASGYPTLLDIIKQQNPNGEPAEIIEMLSKVNPILDDIPMIECNKDLGHQISARTALPGLTWRKLNQGVPFTKSSVQQYLETCGMLEAQNAVDAGFSNVAATVAAYRKSEDMAAIANMNIEMVNALFYYSTSANPERLQGFTPRFNQISGGPVSKSQIVIGDASASGANQTSIWLQGWGPRSGYGIYPKNSTGGIQKEDLGRHMLPDANNNFYAYWVSLCKWAMGLAIADYRYTVRACNIDVTRWRNDISQGADLPDTMAAMRTLLWEENTVMARFYMNRATYGMLNRQLLKKGTVNALEYIEMGKTRIPAFYGIPIRITDGILSTEGVVS